MLTDKLTIQQRDELIKWLRNSGLIRNGPVLGEILMQIERNTLVPEDQQVAAVNEINITKMKKEVEITPEQFEEFEQGPELPEPVVEEPAIEDSPESPDSSE
jgi:hypothetical protein